ncbi:hypothetical protein JVT61DRAFT_623 [Boletus reticuloceps]|uniref:F-box domain-containing protein n=1 Tax=Boletus reticuloceps TaxID=495285 RepID=A0A8I2Z3E0_9AGAM|nr:hypothetical protein JVT61DRAFT_623 [Boletus reticuloceps]
MALQWEEDDLNDLCGFPRRGTNHGKQTGTLKLHSSFGNKVLRQDNSPELPPTNIVAPPAKKRRAGGRVVDVPTKSNRGNPWELCQLNLDVLFMIATYTQPQDLLSLARTCKSLRRLFMDKSSAFIWKAYRRELKGLPDCSDDLSEPAYTNLVFSPHSHTLKCNKGLWKISRYFLRRIVFIEKIRFLCNIYWPRAVYEIVKITAVRVSGDEGWCHRSSRDHTTIAHFAENLLWHDKDQVNSLV